MSPGLNAALPHLLKAAADDLRRVADIVNISSIAGRVAWADYGVYNMTKFGVNGFTEALRQEVTKKRVRVGVLEPGGSRHGPGGRSGSGRRVGSYGLNPAQIDNCRARIDKCGELGLPTVGPTGGRQQLAALRGIRVTPFQ
jgi:NAD(P)-dependent dehydrogenase (short-subunit alcohol dehydrogenase family)